ncbi:hypothetical protein BP6252_10370 [Coleophoma cylindrospora]|uniref:HRQ family protein 2 n=1 Tax=Coleophoma cylindrospora TaxID=1849047 RepID=A0A3D8QSC8_9HELO|nr:hypothetical protein BP6252_10370 [Coleophoma cylindrospora]
MEGKTELAAWAFLILMGLWRLRNWGTEWRKRNPKPILQEPEKKTNLEKPEIEPLSTFNWRNTEPEKLRPFRPKYHLTMALQNSDPSELVSMDNTYLQRLKIRKEAMSQHPDIVLQATPRSIPAINELYTYLVGTYLPTRYPTMFKLAATHLENLVTSAMIPLTPSSDPLETLRTLGENVDEDFIWLQPSEDGDGYVFTGYVVCFPAGFNTKEKLGLKLREIHTPVPGYAEKLEKSMDRFFERLEVGKMWSITTHDKLYAASAGNHLYAGEEVEAEEIDLANTYLRCERQYLHRQPETKALCFSFKTYLYPISQIKAEGLGEDLAQAIDGLKEGSVPEMHFYKKGVVWGETVKEYLRS